MNRVRLVLLLLGLLALSLPARASSLGEASKAITEIDLERAKKLLQLVDSDSTAVAFERARLAIYLGDCDSAQAILSAPSLANTPEGASLAKVARGCAGVVAGAVIVENKEHGVWVRLQDERDRALVPFIVEVARRARDSVGKDLGATLPRPLRIELVRDLFSLAAMTGLPLSAAENTGTVAVARWGRVTMVSPRATPLGYPWEDTLAHEITHLTLSRATRDRAPLWLQEGIAKREESRWRKPRPFDNEPPADAVSRLALLEGRSVGVDRLGPSIAMLPTPQAASTAFAEVTSFVAYWIEQNGQPALALLLADLKGTDSDDPDVAMRSVTGYDLGTWIRRWQAHLRALPGPEADAKTKKEAEPASRRPEALQQLARRVRLGDLLFERGHAAAAAEHLTSAVELAPKDPAVRWRAARALGQSGQAEPARQALGSADDISALHGPWYALHGHWLKGRRDAEAEQAFSLGISLHPLSEDVACEGVWHVPGKGGLPPPKPGPLPGQEPRRALCAAVRADRQN